MGLDFSLKSRKNNIVNNAFRSGAARYTHMRGGRNKSYFTRNDPLDSDNKYTASEICKMTGFLVDDTFVSFDIQRFPQTVGILVQTVPRHWLTCFSIPLIMSLLINSNTLKKFYGRYTDLIGQYEKNVRQMLADSVSRMIYIFADLLWRIDKFS